MKLLRWPRGQFQDVSAVSACSLSSLSIKSLFDWLWVAGCGKGSLPSDRSLPFQPGCWPEKESKLSFPSILALLAFKWRAAGPTLANRLWRQREAVLSRYWAPSIFPYQNAVMMARMAARNSLLKAHWPQERTLGDTICFKDPEQSPLLGTGCKHTHFLGGMETCAWTSWQAPHPSKSICVHFGKLLFWA